MKIHFEMSKKETTVLKNIAIKYAPVDVELKAFQDKLVENKTGRYEIKANDGTPIIDANVNEDLVVEFIKFGEECFGTVVTAINILKPFIENFTGKMKERFKKWAPDPEKKWMSIAKHIASSEKYAGKNFILGVIKDDKWVEIDKDHKVRRDDYTHHPINEIGDLGDVINEADSKKTEYRFIFVIDGNISIINNAVDATYAAEKLGMSYVPKHLAEEGNEEYERPSYYLFPNLKCEKKEFLDKWTVLADAVFSNCKDNEMSIHVLYADGAHKRVYTQLQMLDAIGDRNDDEYTIVVVDYGGYCFVTKEGAERYFEAHGI